MKTLNIKKKFDIDNSYVEMANRVRMKYFNMPMSLQELIEILKEQCNFYKVTVPQNLYLKYGMIIKGDDRKFRFSEKPWNFNSLRSTLMEIYDHTQKNREERKGKGKLSEDKCIAFLKSIKNSDGSDMYVIKKYIPACYEEI